MGQRRNWVAIAVSATQLAACAGLPSGALQAPRTTAEGVITAGHRGAVATAPGKPGSLGTGATVVSNNGGTLIGDKGGALTGRVLAPVGLLANNGGTVISNNGVSYRVAALPAQTPLADVTVELHDAAGHPLKAPDGSPLTARTNAEGRYAFATAPTGRNVLAVVKLLGDAGVIRAVVPKDGGDQRQVDLNLISTLTTTYILAAYVQHQADPAGALDKLPGDVEAETRARAEAALTAVDVVPESLREESLVRTVEALRAGNAAFDQQMETVKRLLVLAGLSDLGNGRLATETSIGTIRSHVEAPAGGVYMAADQDRRVWWLRPDGRLEAMAGSSTGLVDADVDGKPALEAGLAVLRGLAVDGAGRLVMLEDSGRVTRLEGKTLKVVVPAVPTAPVRGLVAGADGRVLLLSRGEVRALGADGALQGIETFDAAGGAIADATMQLGRDREGRLYLGTSQGQLHRYDPGTRAMTLLAELGKNGVDQLTVDHHGHTITVGGTRRTLTVTRPDGTTATLMENLPNDVAFTFARGALVTPDGVAFVPTRLSPNRIYRVEAGQARVVAGSVSVAGGDADDLVLNYPAGVAIASSGELLITESRSGQVIAVDAANQTRVAGTVERPGVLRVAPDGTRYVLARALSSGSEIVKLDAAGQASSVYKGEHLTIIGDFVVAADGTLYLSQSTTLQNPSGYRSEVLRLAPDGTRTVLKTTSERMSGSLALKPDGTLLISANKELSSWSAEQGLATLATHAHFATASDACLAVDGSGRLYLTRDKNVYRFDLAAKTFTTVAGPGGAHFAGTTVNDSLKTPRSPVFDQDGSLVFCDILNRQVKRIPAKDL